MFGDLLATQIRGPLTVAENGKTFLLTRGQPIPPSLWQVGAVFNFDVVDATGKLYKAGTPLPNLNTTMTPGLFPPPYPSQALPYALANGVVTTLVARGAFKISENDSPLPQDRVFLTYNYFNNVAGSLNPPGFPQTDVHREVIGFEKTLFDGNASFEMRLPYIEVTGDGSVRRDDLGDLTMIFKYAFLYNRETGNVLSGGLALTVPTGASFLQDGVPDIHPTLFQPFVGFVYHFGDFYAQGFSAVVVPTDGRDVTSFNNDIAGGCFLYRSRGSFLTSIVPTVELHVDTPLDHPGAQTLDPLPGIATVDMTAGVTLGLGARSQLGLGVVTPLSGPKPFDVEAQVYFNCRF